MNAIFFAMKRFLLGDLDSRGPERVHRFRWCGRRRRIPAFPGELQKAGRPNVLGGQGRLIQIYVTEITSLPAPPSLYVIYAVNAAGFTPLIVVPRQPEPPAAMQRKG
jgi:hypothetical protein